MRKIVAVLLAVCLLGICSGCFHKKASVKLVSEISVQWEDNGGPIHRIFDSPQKMHLILNKLRTLGQRFSSDTDPETLEASVLSITLSYSDGSQQLYQIKPDRYIRIGQEPWQQADPNRITDLRLLLLSLPSDFRT